MGSLFLKWPMPCTAAIAAIVVYCIFTFASLALFPPPYNPIKNWLSDLGNSSYNPKGAAVYNIGCIITGLMLFLFYIGFHSWYTDERWGKSLLVFTQTIGFIVDDAVKWYRRLIRQGSKSAAEPFGDESETLAYVKDPDGIWIEFIGPGRRPTTPNRPTEVSD